MPFLDRVIAKVLPTIPRALVERIAHRYVAGTDRDDVVRVVGELNARRVSATIDLLGEEITEPRAAMNSVIEYEQLLTEIAARRLDSNISLKLTALGLNIDAGMAEENLVRLTQYAGERGNFVWIDMEDQRFTETTLSTFRKLRAMHANLGVVLQARLKRTMADIDALPRHDPPIHVRLCKGIYLEPAHIAWTGREEIRESYTQCLRRLLERGDYVGIATHDRALVDQALKTISDLRLNSSQYEFQMLLGVTPELGNELVQAGHRLRVYVPYGKDWYAYCVRRLQENPEIARNVVGAWFSSR